MKTWMLVDCNYLAWRAYHAIGPLSHNGKSTSVCFGVLRDLEGLINLHSPARTVLAFDSPAKSLRAELYPPYKSGRRNRVVPESEREMLRQFYDELGRFEREILPAAGFRNVISLPGYEADDILAEIAGTVPEDVTAVIVSADGDLLQCLGERVILYNPAKKKAVTAESFRLQWGIGPEQWAEVKAIAGCSTDDVPGVFGVAERTAADYLSERLNRMRPVCLKIQDWLKSSEYIRNLSLCRLPFPGTPPADLTRRSPALEVLS